MKVNEVCALYLRHCEVEGTHCPAAREDRLRTLAMFVKVHGERTIAECRPFHLADFIENNPRWKSTATRRAKCNEVRACFEWAHRGERIERNPFKSVRYAEAERRPDMPDDTLDRIAQLSNKPFERVVRFLRLTGARLGELCEAVWKDVDLERGIWIIPKHKTRKYTGKAKVIALVPEAVALLRVMTPTGAGGVCAGVVLAPTASKAETLFLNTRGRPWNRRTLGQQLRRMKQRHGIDTKASLHGIRHRFGTCAVANKAPIKLISMQLGHSTVQVTERYYCDLTNELDAIRDAARLALPKVG
jgi:integrase